MFKETVQDRENFTLPLALTDLVPVVFFRSGGDVLSALLDSPLFNAGSNICTAAGLCKVGWKVMLAVKGRDEEILNSAFRSLMPAGFAVMAAGVLSHPKRAAGVFARLMGFPQCLWLAAGLAGISAMEVMAKKLDFSRARNNWLAESVNIAAQGAVMRALTLIR